MSAGRIIVSNNAQTVGVHLAQWKSGATAMLAPQEARELIDRLQKALAAIKGPTASDADEDYSDIA